jgi:hypothetical protein
MRLAILVVVAVLALCARAGAATVSTEATQDLSQRPATRLVVSAAPGEANDVHVTFDTARNGWIVSDSGVAPTAGAGCSAEGAGVFCARIAAGDQSAQIDLGDGNDRLDLSGPQGTATIADGDGDDDITIGADSGKVSLTPGLGADVYDSANPQTALDYSARSQGVTITPDGTADDGEPGEHDNVKGTFGVFEGTAQKDEIHAADSGTYVSGGDGGADDLFGGPGDDRLKVWRGSASVYGGAGDDFIDVSRTDPAGVLSGGPGHDTVLFEGDGIHGFMTPIDVSLDGVANDGPPGAARNVMPDIESVNLQVGRLVGSDGPDSLSASNYVDGRAGDDTIYGGGTVIGGPGSDHIYYWGRAGFGSSEPAAIYTRDGEPDVIECLYAPPDLIDADAFDQQTGCQRATPPTPTTTSPKFGAVSRHSVTTRIDRRGYVVLRIACAKTSPAACSGRATLRPRKAARTVYARGKFEGIEPGHSKRVRLKVAARWRRSLARGRTLAARLMVDTTAAGTSATHRDASAGLVRVKPAR